MSSFFFAPIGNTRKRAKYNCGRKRVKIVADAAEAQAVQMRQEHMAKERDHALARSKVRREVLLNMDRRKGWRGGNL